MLNSGSVRLESAALVQNPQCVSCALSSLTVVTPIATSIGLQTIAYMKSKQPIDQEQSLTFEQAYAQIEAIVKQLEQGTLGLDESLAAYQEAVKHLRFCQSKLNEAVRSVELLNAINEDGSYTTTEFDDAESTLQEKASSRSSRRSASKKNEPSRKNDLF